MRKKLFYVVAFLSVVTALSFTKPADRYFEIAKNLDIFATLFKEVNALYVDEVNPNQLVRTGIDAMLNSLDPYTNYIPEDEVEDYRTLNTGQYGGIGAVTREIGKRTVVTMIMEGYGAQKGGLKIGDEVVKIDNIELAKLSREESGQLMKGQIGTPVSLTIKRTGVDQLLKLDFKREKIKVSNVPYYGMVGKDIAYIQLNDFTPDAAKEVGKGLTALKEQGAKGVILDLRGNPGGLLIEAVNITNIFLPKGKLVVSTKGKIPENNLNYETLNIPLDTEIPVTVLINRGSASASEIVAGTLQDYDRGVIIGERSYGKGLVQVSRPLSYNSQLKVTTAKYYTPTGRCIQVLDYAHRREDGSVGSLPDSVKKAFKTTNGRTVYDGGGIDPDVKLEAVELHALSQVLIETGLLFDYATTYASKHTEIADVRTFSLTEEEYQQFVHWMKDKDYAYKSYMEYELEQFTEQARKEKYFSELKGQIDQITNRVAESKKNELTLYKDQVKMLLEKEIAARYYLEKGSVEVAFKYDTEMKKAIDVLHNNAQYKKVLNPSVKMKFRFRKISIVLLVIFSMMMIGLHSCMTFRMSAKEVDKYFVDKKVKGIQESYHYGGREIHYVHAGDESKPLVLFVHGSPGSLSAFIHFLGDTTLLKSALLISTDRPGFGYSNFGLGEPSLEKQSLALKPILEKYKNNKPVILVGHSLGGPLIAKMAMDYPQLIDGLIIVAGSIDPELEPNETWFRAPLSTPFLSWILPRSFRASNEEIYQLKPELVKMLPYWKDITCPVIVIQGKSDSLVPAENADFAKKMLINAPTTFVLVDGMDHFVPWSNPELIHNAILKMMKPDTTLSFHKPHLPE